MWPAPTPLFARLSRVGGTGPGKRQEATPDCWELRLQLGFEQQGLRLAAKGTTPNSFCPLVTGNGPPAEHSQRQ